MINRFVTDGFLRNIELPSEFSEEFCNLTRSNVTGSLATLEPCGSKNSSEWTLSQDIFLPSYHSRHIFNEEELQEVKNLLCQLLTLR